MTSHPFDSEFAITGAHREQFLRDGFVKLEGFLNPSVIAMLLDRVDTKSTSGADNASSGARFSSVHRYLEDGDTEVFDLLERPYFRQAVTGLTRRDLFLAFDTSSEIERNVNKGLPWHIDVTSYGFQFSEQFACSLWAPLHPIDASGQRGGIACVPLHVLPGDFAYSAELAVVEVLKARERAGKTTSPQEYRDLREFLNSPALKELLDVHQVEYDFDPGDVLLFNKTVAHRSVMLGEGELSRRAAYVLRFVDADSRYDLNQARTLNYPAEHYGKGLFPYGPRASQYLQIAEAGAEHGDLISQCAYFSDRDRRMVRRTSDQAAELTGLMSQAPSSVA